MKIRSVPGVE